MLALPRLNGKTFWFLGRRSGGRSTIYVGLSKDPSSLEYVAGRVLASAANASVSRYDEVAAPTGGLEVRGGRMQVYGDAAFDDGDEMGDGDVV